VAEFTKLLLNIKGLGLAASAVGMIVSLTVWRLRGLNEKYGKNGLRIRFALNLTRALDEAFFWALMTTRILPPE
jgi:hypothetical protein